MEILDWVGRAQVLLSIIIFIAALGVYFWVFYKKERLLTKNLSRAIILYYPTGKNFDIEEGLLKDAKLFKIDKSSDNPVHIIDSLHAKKHSLIIAGFDPSDRNNFYKVFEKAAEKSLPFIVYTFGNNQAMEGKDWKKLTNYSYYSVVNSPLRLLNDVFAILSTFPKK